MFVHIVDEPRLQVIAGTVVKLTPESARRRRMFLEDLSAERGPGWFRLTALCEFKRGERVEFAARPPKGVSAAEAPDPAGEITPEVCACGKTRADFKTDKGWLRHVRKCADLPAL